MKRVTSIKEAGELAREMFEKIQDGYSTQYFILELESDEENEFGEFIKEYKIRISDHSARSSNNYKNGDYDNYFSFITDWNRQDVNVTNEWVVDGDGDFTEEYYSIEDCLECNIN